VPELDNKALVRRYLERVVNGVDRGVAEEVVAPDVVFRTVWADTQVNDRDSLIKVFEHMHEAWEGLTIREDALIADGDQVAIRWTHIGRHVGEYFGFPPTGQELEASGMAFYRISDGRIAEAWLESRAFQILFTRAKVPEGATLGQLTESRLGAA